MNRDLYLVSTEGLGHGNGQPLHIINHRKFKLGHKWILICDLKDPITLSTEYYPTEIKCKRLYIVSKHTHFGKDLTRLNEFPIYCFVYREIRSAKLKVLKKSNDTGIIDWGALYSNLNVAQNFIDKLLSYSL